MGAVVFDNTVFDAWLNNKSQEILSKVDREKITTEEMIILVLKAQTNHFYHMDLEFRGEFKSIYQHFRDVKEQFKIVDQRFEKIDQRFEKIDQRFEKIDQRFEKMDKKIEDGFDRQNRFLMWQGGLMMAMFSGIYLKLFLG